MRTSIFLLFCLLFLSPCARAQKASLVRASKAAAVAAERKSASAATASISKTVAASNANKAVQAGALTRVSQEQIAAAYQRIEAITALRTQQENIKNTLFKQWKTLFYTESKVPARLEQAILSHLDFVLKNTSKIELQMTQSLEFASSLNYYPWLQGKKTVFLALTPSPNSWEQANLILDQLRIMNPESQVLVISEFPFKHTRLSHDNYRAKPCIPARIRPLEHKEGLALHEQANTWAAQIKTLRNDLSVNRKNRAEPITLIIASHPYADGDIGLLLEKNAEVYSVDKTLHISIRTQKIPDISGTKTDLLESPLREFPKPYTNNNIYGALVTHFGTYGKQVGMDLLVEVTPNKHFQWDAY